MGRLNRDGLIDKKISGLSSACAAGEIGNEPGRAWQGHRGELPTGRRKYEQGANSIASTGCRRFVPNARNHTE